MQGSSSPCLHESTFSPRQTSNMHKTALGRADLTSFAKSRAGARRTCSNGTAIVSTLRRSMNPEKPREHSILAWSGGQGTGAGLKSAAIPSPYPRNRLMKSINMACSGVFRLGGRHSRGHQMMTRVRDARPSVNISGSSDSVEVIYAVSQQGHWSLWSFVGADWYQSLPPGAPWSVAGA